MKQLKYLILVFNIAYLLIACIGLHAQGMHVIPGVQFSQSEDVQMNTGGTPLPFEVTLREKLQSSSRPALESFVYAYAEPHLLIIGGRKAGFHGLTNPNGLFPVREANDSIWVIDIQSGMHWGVPIPEEFSQQLSSTNMQFTSRDGVLYITGGYGSKLEADTLFNHTFDQLIAINIDGLIGDVIAEADMANLAKHFLYSIADSFVQVTGGEMDLIGDTFYLVMGQNYEGQYTPGRTGNYTEEVRAFQIDSSMTPFELKAKAVYPSPARNISMHRRDYNLVRSIRNGEEILAGYGGVFTSNDEGWLHPLFFTPGQNGMEITSDTFNQVTNNYSCAVVPYYDQATGSMFTAFLGGISHAIYIIPERKFQVGDEGIPLPFTNSISTITLHRDGTVTGKVQLPPAEPTMPRLLGAEACFVPVSDLLYDETILDYSKLASADSVVVGYMYGGILSTAASTSRLNPSFATNAIYEVVFRKPGDQ